jgi:hypothetical protein
LRWAVKLTDGDRCPKTRKHVMIRSDDGCLKCDKKKRLIGNGHKLYVVCRYKK